MSGASWLGAKFTTRPSPRPPVDRPPLDLAGRASLTLATWFGAGLSPVAPGTAGTAAAIPLAWALSYAGPAAYVATTLAVTLVGMVVAQRAGRHYGVADARQIVIDEVAGYLVTMAFVPFGVVTALAGFLLFRVADVFKPWPASYFDKRWKNGAGVVLDDVVAAFYSRAAMVAVVAAGRRFGWL